MCCPIGITTHHDKVHVDDQSNHCVSVYRTSGEYCFSFGSNGYIPSMDLWLNFHASSYKLPALQVLVYVPQVVPVSQGCTQNLMWVGSFQEKVDLFDFDMVQVCEGMLKLGESGGMPPQEIFEK